MSSEAAGPRVRNVTFKLDDNDRSAPVVGAEDGNVDSSSETLRSPRKSVLKQRQSGSIPPPSHYQHPDPLLRRLRLRDGYGNPVDLRSTFREAKLVLFYFGSQWNASESRGCQRLVSDLCREYPHELKTVYISVDTDVKHYEAATRNRPWLSMEWNDGSSLDPDKEESAQEVPAENFLLADDPDTEEFVVQSDPAGTSYVRPLSRVYMASKFEVLITPTLVAYHIPTRRILDHNVRISRLRSSRAKDTLSLWLKGEPSPSMNFVDILYITPLSFVLAVIVLLYLCMRITMGDQVSLPHLISG